MEKKKILIVTSAFYPEISPRSFRATELAKELARQGHYTSVLTLNRGAAYDEFRKENGNIKITTIQPLRWPYFGSSGPKLISLVKRGIARLLSILFEYPSIELVSKFASALKFERGYDILISIAVPYPIHWGVAKVWDEKRQLARVWIADCGDPYMGANLDSYRKMFYFKYVEKWFCRKADVISIPFDGLQNYFYPEFKEKFVVIPQGVEIDSVKLFEGELNNPVPTFAFAGSVIPGFRDLDKFIKYLQTKSFDFKFIIYTKQPDFFIQFQKEMNGKLILLEYIPRDQLIYELSKFDFLVNVDTRLDSSENLVAIPSKLIDYSLSGRPILNISSHELNINVIEEFLIGNYQNQRFIDIDKHNTKNVTSQFLQAADSFLTNSKKKVLEF